MYFCTSELLLSALSVLVLLKFPFGKVSSVFAGFSLPYIALQPYMLCRFMEGKQRSIIRQQILR